MFVVVLSAQRDALSDELACELVRVLALTEVVANVVRHFEWRLDIGKEADKRRN